MAKTSARKTAFVFAGGGSLGAVQVGALKALTRHGVQPDFVVGASVGAINGACYAAEPDESGVARLERIWLRLRRADVFPLSLISGILGLFGSSDHFVAPGPLRALIESALPHVLLEATRIPCHVVATGVLDGGEVVLSSGPAATALLASAAIPGVFPTVSVDDRQLMDGGVASNTPISAAVDLGATRVIVLPTGVSCALEAPPRGAVALALHALNMLVMRQLLRDIERFSDRCELIVVPPLCPLTTTTYDFSQSKVLIRRAEASTRLWLSKGGLESRDAPPSMFGHRHGST